MAIEVSPPYQKPSDYKAQVAARSAAAEAKASLSEQLQAAGIESIKTDFVSWVCVDNILGNVPGIDSDRRQVLVLALQGYPDKSYIDAGVLAAVGVAAMSTVVLAPIGAGIVSLAAFKAACQQGAMIQNIVPTSLSTGDALDTLAAYDPHAASYVATIILNNAENNDYTLKMLSAFKKHAWYGLEYVGKGVATGLKNLAETIGDAVGRAIGGLGSGLGLGGWALVLAAAAGAAWWFGGRRPQREHVAANRRRKRSKGKR